MCFDWLWVLINTILTDFDDRQDRDIWYMNVVGKDEVRLINDDYSKV